MSIARTKRTYPKEIEAAWYVLKDFIHPLDCSETFEKRVVRLNPNATLNHLFNKEKVRLTWSSQDGYAYEIDQEHGEYLRPWYFSKVRLEKHYLVKDYKAYYNSKLSSCPSLGYHGYDEAYKSLPFHKDLGITGKVERFDKHLAILLGIDIDCHQGETDGLELVHFLLGYFPGAYWEPSSRGFHIYAKMQCRKDHRTSLTATLRYVDRVLHEYCAYIDTHKKSIGIQAKLDKPCGLPMVLNWNKQTNQVSVVRSQTISIPLFGSDGNSLPRMERITDFYHSPWQLFDTIDQTVIEYKLKDLLTDTQTEEPSVELLKEVLDWEEQNPGEEPTGDTTGDRRINDYPRPGVTLQEALQMHRQEPNTYLKLLNIGHAYMRENIVQNTEELYQGLLPLDLWRKEKPRKAILKILQQVVEFRQQCGAKRSFSFKGFDQYRARIVQDLEKILQQKPVDLTYSKSRNRRSRISLEKVAAMYFAMRKSLWANQERNARTNATPFSNRTARAAVKEILGTSISPTEATRILAILLELGSIWKLGGYCPGKAGQKYGVRDHLGGLVYEQDYKDVREWIEEEKPDAFLEELERFGEQVQSGTGSKATGAERSV